jgi:hypothetical protein
VATEGSVWGQALAISGGVLSNFIPRAATFDKPSDGRFPNVKLREKGEQF